MEIGAFFRIVRRCAIDWRKPVLVHSDRGKLAVVVGAGEAGPEQQAGADDDGRETLHDVSLT